MRQWHRFNCKTYLPREYIPTILCAVVVLPSFFSFIPHIPILIHHNAFTRYCIICCVGIVHLSLHEALSRSITGRTRMVNHVIWNCLIKQFHEWRKKSVRASKKERKKERETVQKKKCDKSSPFSSLVKFQNKKESKVKRTNWHRMREKCASMNRSLLIKTEVLWRTNEMRHLNCLSSAHTAESVALAYRRRASLLVCSIGRISLVLHNISCSVRRLINKALLHGVALNVLFNTWSTHKPL